MSITSRPVWKQASPVAADNRVLYTAALLKKDSRRPIPDQRILAHDLDCIAEIMDVGLRGVLDCPTIHRLFYQDRTTDDPLMLIAVPQLRGRQMVFPMHMVPAVARKYPWCGQAQLTIVNESDLSSYLFDADDAGKHHYRRIDLIESDQASMRKHFHPSRLEREQASAQYRAVQLAGGELAIKSVFTHRLLEMFFDVCNSAGIGSWYQSSTINLGVDTDGADVEPY